MKISICIGDVRLMAVLDDNKAAKDFAALLPLQLTLEDYAATEKISDLPRRLSTAGVPEGTSAAAGDIAYYAPSGNLAIFYRDSAYARGLVKLGSIASGVDTLRRSGPLQATIKLAEA